MRDGSHLQGSPVRGKLLAAADGREGWLARGWVRQQLSSETTACGEPSGGEEGPGTNAVDTILHGLGWMNPARGAESRDLSWLWGQLAGPFIP